MGLKRVATSFVRKLVGLELVSNQISELESSMTNILRHNEATILNVNHVVLEINRELKAIQETVLNINHRATLIEEIAPLIGALGDVSHRLKDLDIAAVQAANQVALDAEGVAVMVRLVEKLMNDLVREISRVSSQNKKDSIDSATER